MPTYEYACRRCGHRFETVQAMAESALTTCPQCGGELRKVFHPAGIAFKGSGFYATDSRKKSTSSTAAPSAKDSSKEGGSKGDGKSDTATPSKDAPAKDSGGSGNGDKKTSSGDSPGGSTPKKTPG